MSEISTDKFLAQFQDTTTAFARMSEERRVRMALLPTLPPPSRMEQARSKIRRVKYETRDRLQHAWGALKGERCDW